MSSRIGEVAIASNGQTMTIIAYRKSTDIDIQFDDGTIRLNCRYDNFKKGHISNPNAIIGSERIGEQSLSKYGQTMTIIAYRTSTDIDIRFSDGTIKENVRYDNFKNGNISNPNFDIGTDRIGEQSIAKNGQTMTIIEYRSSTDIDIKFDDGTIRQSVRYDNFRNGLIANPNNCLLHIGEEVTANNGQKLRIIEFRTATDIDVQFDDGTIRNGIRYDNFLNGAVANPNRLLSSSSQNHNSKEITNLSLGMKAIVKVISSKGLNFQLEKIFDQCFFRGYLPFDIFIPNIGLIEFDGEQHFRNNGFYTSDDGFLEGAIRDQVKNCFCEVSNIPLLRIRFDQMNDIESMINDFLNNPQKYLRYHNTLLSNESYYSIRQSAICKSNQ